MLALEGRLDTTAPELEQEIKSSLNSVTELIMDLAKLDYVSSADLRVLLSAHKTMIKQVSGLCFEYDSTIESPCVKDEKGFFDHVDETKEQRVRNVLVAGRPIEADATYTLASAEVYLLGNLDSYTMFNRAEILQNGEIMDIEALYFYISEVLDGHIGKGYEDIYGESRIVSVNPES